MAEYMIPFDDDFLVLEIQLRDIQEQREQLKEKWNEYSPPDFFMALKEYETQLKKNFQCIQDSRVAHSIARAVELDATAIREVTMEESQAYQDHSIALQLNENGTEINDNGTERNYFENITFDSKNKVSATLRFSRDDSLQNDVELSYFKKLNDNLSEVYPLSSAGPSHTYVHRQQEVLEKFFLRNYECVVCRGNLEEGENIQVGCPNHHVFCQDCLRSLYSLSISDEELFPPKCCGNKIPFRLLAKYLTKEESKRYFEAKLEFSTTNRIYCCRPSCGRFIPKKQSDVDCAQCLACGNEVCLHCKKDAHSGECPADIGFQKLVALANQNFWVRCYQCRAMVERKQGCNCMSCRCGAQFCYKCSQKWKTCQCSDYEYVTA